MENFLMDIAGESKEFYRLLDDMAGVQPAVDRTSGPAIEYDGLALADGLGRPDRPTDQTRSLAGEFSNPATHRCFSGCVRAAWMSGTHTDGQVRDIFGDLIEIGVQVINCQVPVVGHEWIASNVRARVAIRTDIDRQR